MISLAASVFGIAAFKSVLAQDTYFINPPDAGTELYFGENIAHQEGSKLEVQWSSNRDEYAIWLWQQSLSFGTAALGQTVYTKILGGPEASSFNWTVTSQSFDLSQSNVFFFALGPTEEINDNTTTSHYFNITAAQQTTSSDVSSTATFTPTSTRSGTAATVSTTATGTSSPNNAQPDGSSDNQTTLKIGLGVGIGVGIPLLAICVYLAVRYGRKHRDQSPTQTQASHASTGAPPIYEHKQAAPSEMSGLDQIQRPSRQTGLPAYGHGPPVELPVDRSSFRA